MHKPIHLWLTQQVVGLGRKDSLTQILGGPRISIPEQQLIDVHGTDAAFHDSCVESALLVFLLAKVGSSLLGKEGNAQKTTSQVLSWLTLARTFSHHPIKAKLHYVEVRGL